MKFSSPILAALSLLSSGVVRPLVGALQLDPESPGTLLSLPNQMYPPRR